jgi:uncharacterized membrane protein YfcA
VPADYPNPYWFKPTSSLILLFSIFLITSQWKKSTRENWKRALTYTAIISLATIFGSLLAIVNASRLTEMRWRWEREKRLDYTV